MIFGSYCFLFVVFFHMRRSSIGVFVQNSCLILDLLTKSISFVKNFGKMKKSVCIIVIRMLYYLGILKKNPKM